MAYDIREGKYLSTDEVVNILGLSKVRVNQLAREGRLRCIDIGHVRLIPVEAIPEYKRHLVERKREELRRMEEAQDDS